jgi:hypothetical protein
VSAYRVSRWIAVWLVAFALRRGISHDEIMTALARAYHRHRDDARWRLDIVADAERRNARKRAHA